MIYRYRLIVEHLIIQQPSPEYFCQPELAHDFLGPGMGNIAAVNQLITDPVHFRFSW